MAQERAFSAPHRVVVGKRIQQVAKICHVIPTVQSISRQHSRQRSTQATQHTGNEVATVSTKQAAARLTYQRHLENMRVKTLRTVSTAATASAHIQIRFVSLFQPSSTVLKFALLGSVSGAPELL